MPFRATDYPCLPASPRGLLQFNRGCKPIFTAEYAEYAETPMQRGFKAFAAFAVFLQPRKPTPMRSKR